MKMIENPVCECGVKFTLKTETGYMSARSLGRPGGAKGEDTWAQWYECPGCGKICGELPQIPESCHICGNPSPVQEHDLCTVCEEVTGMWEWVPGIENSVNTCGEKCSAALKTKVGRIMEKSCRFFE